MKRKKWAESSRAFNIVQVPQMFKYATQLVHVTRDMNACYCIYWLCPSYFRGLISNQRKMKGSSLSVEVFDWFSMRLGFQKTSTPLSKLG